VSQVDAYQDSNYLWKWMLHIAVIQFWCSADDVGNPDTLRGNVQRVMMYVTWCQMSERVGLNTSSLEWMWPQWKHSVWLQNLQWHHWKCQKCQKV
jgi:hypothetical protein